MLTSSVICGAKMTKTNVHLAANCFHEKLHSYALKVSHPQAELQENDKQRRSEDTPLPNPPQHSESSRCPTNLPLRVLVNSLDKQILRATRPLQALPQGFPRRRIECLFKIYEDCIRFQLESRQASCRCTKTFYSR
jgi:hypothetical protein